MRASLVADCRERCPVCCHRPVRSSWSHSRAARRTVLRRLPMCTPAARKFAAAELAAGYRRSSRAQGERSSHSHFRSRSRMQVEPDSRGLSLQQVRCPYTPGCPRSYPAAAQILVRLGRCTRCIHCRTGHNRPGAGWAEPGYNPAPELSFQPKSRLRGLNPNGTRSCSANSSWSD